MKAAQWFAPRDIRLVEVEKPVPKPNEALIKVESVGICGSDLHYYLDGRIGSTVITRPIILGHEFGGIVETVGGNADPSLIGKRVAVEPGIPCLKCEWCRTGHYNVCPNLFFPGGPPYDGVLCEYAAFHADFCFPVPNDLGAVEAAMIEPLAVAVHTVELALLKPGETAAILGLGPIGLLTAQVAQRAGAGLLIGSDRLDYRVGAGLHYGLDVAFNADQNDTVEAIMEITHGRGVDAVFDTARSSDTPALACKVVRPAGRCVFTGISGEDYDPIPVGVARRKELTIRWCRRFRHDYPRAIEMAAGGMVDVKSLVTHNFPLEGVRDAFELVAAHADNVLKVSVDL